MFSGEDSHFTRQDLQEVSQQVGENHRATTPYHSQISGQAETSNKEDHKHSAENDECHGEKNGKADYPRHPEHIEYP